MAFKKSENDYGHSLPLILADRVYVVDGIIDDFVKGKVPNIFAEKGYVAEWKHNKTGLFTIIAVVVGIADAIVMLARNDRE